MESESVSLNEAREIFTKACEKTVDERLDFVEGQCAGKPELRDLVLSLLRTHDEQTKSLFTPGIAHDGTQHADYQLVGNYRIVDPHHPLGEGGMGIVYRAEQLAPDGEVLREVALKVIRPGIASRDLFRRFEHETSVLARLQHPGIATIFEVGTFDSGDGAQPFFAMELIRGMPLIDYVREHHLSNRDRLKLFVEICRAISHAHDRGIVHRDLKPANILIDEHNQPKVLDFGIARATGEDVRVTTLRTNVGQLIGTLAYMSPEQTRGSAQQIDHRSDVYSLGIVLFELLVDRLPYDLSGKMIHEAVQIIQEEEPTRLSTVNRYLHGDVETIVSKALEKDPSRRYQTVDEFAQDIHHFLNNEPIIARPQSTWYQFTKFAKRNRAAVTSTMVIFVVLILGIIVSSIFAIQANRARLEAQAIAEEAQSTTEFLQDVMMTNRHSQMGRHLTLETLLHEAAERLKTDDTSPARTRLRHWGYLIQASMRIGAYDKAAEYAHELLALRDTIVSMPEREYLTATYRALDALMHNGEFVAAEQVAMEGYDLSLATAGFEDRMTLLFQYTHGFALEKLRRYDEAIVVLQESWQTRARVLGEHDVNTLIARRGYALTLARNGDPESALPHLEEIVRSGIVHHGSENENTWTAAWMASLGDCLRMLGRYEEAEHYIRRAVDGRILQMSDNHLEVLLNKHRLATVLLAMEREQEAETLWQTVLDTAATYGLTDHFYITMAREEYVAYLQSVGRTLDAEMPGH